MWEGLTNKMGQKNKKIKNGSLSAVFVALGEEVLPRVLWTRYSEKRSLPRVLQIRHSGKYFFCCFLPQFFLRPSYNLTFSYQPNLLCFPAGY
jgi:hypothetical protein